MIIRPGSQADARRKLNGYRKARDGNLRGEIAREKYYAEKALREKKNREALKYFIKCLKKELSCEELTVVSPVFEKWEQNHFCRNAILAHNDIEKLLVVSKEKVEKCQMKLQLFMELNK